MRITLISKACIVGSYQTKLEALAEHDDVELTVVVPPAWRENGRSQHLERAHTIGYELVVAPLRWNGHYHLHYYPTLAEILRTARPDLCHIDEEPYNLATWLASKAAHRVGARTLFFTWQNIHRRYPPPFAQFESQVYRRSHAAIAGNRDAERVLRDKGFESPIRVIPQFGVDTDLFRPAPPRKREDRLTVGYAGRLVEEKGVSALLEALAQLQGPWRWIVCGSGPLRGQLESRLRELGLVDRVRFHDQVPSGDMPRYLNMMDLLVLPSLTRPNWREQFGRILIEAMACQVPVIGSDSGEIPHVIGDAGLIFPEGDVRALGEAISALQGDDARRRELGQAGRARVLAHFTMRQIAGQTVDFYRLLASS